MKTSSIILLGLGVSIAMVLSAGAVYGMTGQAASQRGTTAGTTITLASARRTASSPCLSAW
jgi:hypothetical protein